jgi:hypothetical protein
MQAQCEQVLSGLPGTHVQRNAGQERSARPSWQGNKPESRTQGMSLALGVVVVLGAWFLSAATSFAATNSGLWVGEVTLTKVNESVGGINAANQLVFNDPKVPTPVASSAHLRIILHVDSQGQVRLLKSVAALSKGSNQPPALITDPSLYPNFSSSAVGRRVTAAAFDFGDGNADRILNLVAVAAAKAAASGLDPTQAANLVVQYAGTNAVNPTLNYSNFISSATFASSAGIVAGAAAAAVQAAPSASQSVKQTLAKGAALKALTDDHVFDAADAVPATEAKLDGSISPGGQVTGTLYLGASHPTNPFMHRRHPDHSIGYQISRALTIQFDPPNGTNALVTAGFGVDKITGNYHEEITGLHKPLGPNQDTGLITEGPVVLNRISQVDTLNQ